MKVAKVEPIRENEVPKRLRYARGLYLETLKGARITLEVDESTAVAAAQALESEAARAATLVVPVDSSSPLAVPSPTVVVRPEAPGIVVEVRGDGGLDPGSRKCPKV